MSRILVAMSLAVLALASGCQTAPTLGKVPAWRFPCGYRAFNAGACNNLNGLQNADFNVSSRLIER